MKGSPKKVRPSAAARLPDDLVVSEILTRLPAKALIRFNSVSKNWRSVISSPTPGFVRLQSHRAASIVVSKWLHSRPTTFVTKLPRSIGFPCFGNYFKLFLNFNHPPSIVASCNGLLCCVDSKMPPRKVVIGNPSLNNWELLPNIPCSDVDYRGGIIHGFAVDVRESCIRYKLLVMIEIKYRVFEVYIFDSTTQHWNLASGRVKLPRNARVDVDKVAVYAKGTIYWSLKHDSRMLWFDMENNQYGLRTLPSAAPKCGHIGECHGRLSYTMICGTEIQMWTLDEERWSKRLLIPLQIITGGKLQVCPASGHNMLRRKKKSTERDNTPSQVLQDIIMLPFEGGDSLSFCRGGMVYSCNTLTDVISKQGKLRDFVYNLFPYKNTIVSLPKEAKEKTNRKRKRRI